MLGDVWSFQIASDKNTPAMLKDGIRRMLGKQTGEETWAKAEVVESKREDGPVEFPTDCRDSGMGPLKGFGSGAIVIWGGSSEGGEAVG
jgi:hypothetical protein